MIIAPEPERPAASELRDATFSGEVWATPVVPGAEDVAIASIFFAPGARTHWHSHERGQILQVASGSGLVCARGGQPHRLRAGDTVWAPPDEVHWHGAAPGAAMSHVAISLGTTRWGEAVDDADYANAADESSP